MYNNLKIKIGTAVGTTKEVYLNPKSPNCSVLITGMSGNGKTRAMWDLMEQICTSGGSVLTFNLNSTCTGITCSNTKYYSLHDQGIPFPLFDPVKIGDKEEDIQDVVDSITDVFSMIGSLGKKQRIFLRSAIEHVALGKEAADRDLEAVGEILQSFDDASAEIVYHQFNQIFRNGKITPVEGLLEPGKVTVIDLDGFSSQSQAFMMQMMLAFLWRYQRANGMNRNHQLFIACDEFQNLDMKKKSVLSEILREGRRYRLGLLLATQTIATFKPEERIVVQQAATKLFFGPAKAELNKVLSYITTGKSETLKAKLATLKVGQCIASGNFLLGSSVIDHPVHLSFIKE